MTRRRAVGVLAVLLVAVACISVSVALAARPQARTAELLPDLEIAPPSGLVVRKDTSTGKTRFLLGFESAADNVGAGPLKIRGAREGVEQAEMQADQIVVGDDGTQSLIPDVGTLRYVIDPTHQHWHLTPFMRYELRHERGFRLAQPDTKSGFCLGDRYVTDPEKRLRGEPVIPVYNTNCGLGETGLLAIEEGISVGWGDNYEAWRDGQYLDLTGLPKGRYVLVHRVNSPRALRESSYANNASSALISLTWPRGHSAKPRVRVLAICPHKARCRA
jgi:Lysyl oxidase